MPGSGPCVSDGARLQESGGGWEGGTVQNNAYRVVSNQHGSRVVRMNSSEELFAIADRLAAAASSAEFSAAKDSLNKLEVVSQEAGRAFSGSWLGYHANVYYADLQPPPPGAHFSQEWGLEGGDFSPATSSGWQEYDPEKLYTRLRAKADDPDLSSVEAASAAAAEIFGEAKANIRSILLTESSDRTDTFLSQLLDDLDGLKPLTTSEILQSWAPNGQIMTRDAIVVGQGTRVPPHQRIKAEVAAIRQPFLICAEANKISRKAASHLERKAKRIVRNARIGTNVFIGHGRSNVWLELKNFIQDRLRLPVDEFNRVPVAGVTNQARLAEMLDAAAVALVVMTAEDETAEGDFQARMNVTHEVGLFQGRLGFTKAIVVLEESCKEFSNIQGLGQIRFSSGNIASCFEEVRRVLEREGVIDS